MLRERGLSVDHVRALKPASTAAPQSAPRQSPQPQISGGTILLLAAACGLIVANIYYAQPLIGPIAQSLGLPPQAGIVTLSQAGYGAGLLFIVPLGDLVENRRLALFSIGFSAIALAAAAFAPSAAVFLVCAGAIGLGSVAVQILAPPARRDWPAPQPYAAFMLTVDVAILVRSLSVSISSRSVASRSFAASLRPSSLAQVLSVP